MDKPLWGLRVLKFDGAIAPRVVVGAFGAILRKTFTTGLRPWENSPTSCRRRGCMVFYDQNAYLAI